jgi:hypothetical protein
MPPALALPSCQPRCSDIEDVVYRPIEDRAQLKAPLILASRRGDHSAVIRQFLKLTKQTARSFCTAGK